MTVSDPLVIRNVATGVPGLDAVLGGGLCEYSFNLIAGAPGSGKTTLVQQILFANATRERPALYFTVLGEPTIKMIRYQPQFGFFDPARVPSAVRFVNLASEATGGDLDAVFQRIVDRGGRGASRRSSPSIRFERSSASTSRRRSRRRDRAGALRQSPRAAADDVGSHVVPDRRILRHGADDIRSSRWPTRSSGCRRTSTAIRRRASCARSRFAGEARCRDCTRFGSPMPACRCFREFRSNSGNASFVGTAPRDRSSRTRRDDGRRHSGRRRRAAHRPRRKRQDDVRHAVRGAGTAATARTASSRCSRNIPKRISLARQTAFGRSRQHDRRRTARRHLSAAARSVGRRDAGRDPGRGRTHRRDARRHRFALGLRSRACADVSHGLSRIAVSVGRRAHGDRSDGAHDGRGRRRESRRAVHARAGLVHHRRHHRAALCRDRAAISRKCSRWSRCAAARTRPISEPTT